MSPDDDSAAPPAVPVAAPVARPQLDYAPRARRVNWVRPLACWLAALPFGFALVVGALSQVLDESSETLAFRAVEVALELVLPACNVALWARFGRPIRDDDDAGAGRSPRFPAAAGIVSLLWLLCAAYVRVTAMF